MSTVTQAAPAVVCEHEPPLELQLLRGFELRRGDEPADVPCNVQRVLALLAIRGRAQHRHLVAGTLWADSTEEHAGASLRTALWRARRIDRRLVETRGAYIRVGVGVGIDLDQEVDAARRLADDPTVLACIAPAMRLCVDELLPEWYDDWVLIERERLRQIRLHSLEAIARQLSVLKMHALAVEAALAAVAAEPLRESAQAVLIRVHLAEGNRSEAVRQYDAFRLLTLDMLGIEPSDDLRRLVAPCR